jgi:archaetidylinositol phosphate synthase
MDLKPFPGDTKVGTSLFHGPEQRFINWAVVRIPPWIKSYHLTLATIPISIAIIVFSFLAKLDDEWLWGVSVMIVIQWMTDTLDGSVGRLRKEGLVRWGYYMDHFLDYIFLCTILIGYMVLLPDTSKFLHFFILALFGAFMVSAYLAVSASDRFRITFFGIGPTEIRLLFIVINTLLLIFGKTYLAVTLPYVLGASLIGLAVVVYHTQRELWGMDMSKKVTSHESRVTSEDSDTNHPSQST